MKYSHSSLDLPYPASPTIPISAGPSEARRLLGGGDHALELHRAAHERRLEPGAAAHATDAGHHPERGPSVNGLLAPFDLVQPGVLVGDRGFGHPPGHVIDEHGPRRGDRLQPRRRVDRVAQHHSLAIVAKLHRGVAGQNPGADAKLGQLDLLAERSDRLGQRQRRPHGPLRVVLARDRCPPDGHHGIPDELLDRPAIPLDQRPAAIEIAAQEFADLLGVAVLAERCEPDQVREQHRHQTALG